jgi:REP element-mobilizing transposase RayT
MNNRPGYQIRDQNAIHFLTFATVQWVDVFTRTAYADIAVESLIFCQDNKGLNVHAWCIMSNHVHLIVSAREGHTLSDIIRDFKKFTAQRILAAIENNPSESRKNWMLWLFKSAGQRNKRNDMYQFWQQDNHPEECTTAEMLESKLTYVHENPKRAGLVRQEWDYVYSSAIDYYTNQKGLLKIDFV